MNFLISPSSYPTATLSSVVCIVVRMVVVLRQGITIAESRTSAGQFLFISDGQAARP